MRLESWQLAPLSRELYIRSQALRAHCCWHITMGLDSFGAMSRSCDASSTAFSPIQVGRRWESKSTSTTGDPRIELELTGRDVFSPPPFLASFTFCGPKHTFAGWPGSPFTDHGQQSPGEAIGGRGWSISPPAGNTLRFHVWGLPGRWLTESPLSPITSLIVSQEID